MSDKRANKKRRDWWDRTFDNGPAAKKGCFGFLALAGLLIIAGPALFSSQQSEQQGSETDSGATGTATSEAPRQIAEAKPAPAPVDTAMTAKICKAAIAKLFAHPNTIIDARPIGDGMVRTSYRRPSDNTLWKNECKLEGNRVIWRSVDAFPGTGPGRWRTGEYDGVVTYSIVNGEVIVEEKL